MSHQLNNSPTQQTLKIMSITRQAIMLIGFGGPASPKEVRPFLESVLRGSKISQARFEEVLRHYEAIGGVSPYNAATFRQKKALERWLEDHDLNLPVLVGFSHSKPSFKDVFLSLKEKKIERVIGVVLSPLRSYASFDKYLARLEEANKEAGADSIAMSYTGSFYNDPLFIEAQAARVEEILNRLSKEERSKIFLLFSAHSIPDMMSQESGYAEQFIEVTALVSKRLGIKNGGLAYQSRSGNPSDAWLSPDIKETIATIDREKFQTLVLVPAGFLNENAEILYDLDIDARQKAKKFGLRYLRAAAVADHPKFIEMIGRSILCASR